MGTHTTVLGSGKGGEIGEHTSLHVLEVGKGEIGEHK